ncbi:MAG: hypothetical protein WAP19_06730 [Caldicoprobacterales bacterium]
MSGVRIPPGVPYKKGKIDLLLTKPVNPAFGGLPPRKVEALFAYAQHGPNLNG